MDEHEWLAESFEANREHLRGVAYRLLGSLSEADDAVQEAWLRCSRAGTSGVENLGGWLTTIVARVSLDMLRSRKARREEPLDAAGSELGLKDSPNRVQRGAHTAPDRTDPDARRCWPTRSVSRCWWCLRRFPLRSGWLLCCTTCSPCPLTKSRPS